MDSSLDHDHQFSIFKDCLARRILSHPGLAESEVGSASADIDSDLDEFTSYLASETWPVIPPSLQALSHNQSGKTRGSDSALDIDEIGLDVIPTSFTDTLMSYGIAADEDGARDILRRVLEQFAQEALAPPPAWSSTRAAECEICERDVPLTYHHLIPRATHAKALKRKWHPEALLNSVAWLCRPCHSAVHGVARNEELAREYYTVELLLKREDIQKWRKYAAKQRYGKRRG